MTRKTNEYLLTCVCHFFGFIAVVFLYIVNVGFYKYGFDIPYQLWCGTIFQSVVSLLIYFDLQRTRALYAKIDSMWTTIEEVEKEAQKQLNKLQK